MTVYLAYGIVLGLSAGVAPGPLLTLVISQTLQYGVKEGIRVACAPLLTDIPIICAGLLLIAAFDDQSFALGAVSFVGFVFLAYLGVTSLFQSQVTLTLTEQAPRSYLKGMASNVLNPHPYLFWLSVGVPTTLSAAAESLWSAAVFVAAFYVCIVGAKVLISIAVGRSRRFLSSSGYLWTIRGLGLLLIAFALRLLYDGMLLTGVI